MPCNTVGQVKIMYKRILNKVYEALGINEALNSPTVQKKKLMQGNALLYSKQVFRLICAGITFLVMAGINILGRLLLDVGKIVQGYYSPAILFIPTYRLIAAYIFGALVAAGICFYIHIKIRINYKELNVGQKGHARTMERWEVADRFPKIPEKTDSFEGYGGAPVARDGNSIYIDNTVVNNIIYAITRGGKTEGLAIPTIDILSRASEKASMIIPDSKGTLSNACIGHLARRGYMVYILDLFEFSMTNFYNPLHEINLAYQNGKIDLMEELATDLAYMLIEDTGQKDKFWIDAPRALYSATILALVEDCNRKGCPEKVTPYSIFLMLSALGKPKNKKKLESGLDNYFLNRPLTNPARLAYTAIEFSEGKTRSSLLSITISEIDAYRRSSIAKITAKNDIPLETIGFGEKPVAIFLRVPFYNRSYDGLVSAFISQAFYINMRLAALTNNGKCARRVRVVGDEFFNFPALPNLDNMVTVCLGTGWSFDFYAQSFTQAEKKYGKEVAKIVLDNCATTYFLASPDKETREKVSELCGQITIENVTRSGERFSINKSITEQFEERPLIPPQELSELKDGEMIVFPTMHRKNLSGDKVTPLPIFNFGEYCLKYRHEYLQEFNPEDMIPYDMLNTITGGIQSVELDKYAFVPGTTSSSTESYLKTVNDNLSVDSICSPTQIQFIRQQLPLDFDADIEKMSITTFNETVEVLYAQGDLSEVSYRQINHLTQKLQEEA